MHALALPLSANSKFDVSLPGGKQATFGCVRRTRRLVFFIACLFEQASGGIRRACTINLSRTWRENCSLCTTQLCGKMYVSAGQKLCVEVSVAGVQTCSVRGFLFEQSSVQILHLLASCVIAQLLADHLHIILQRSNCPLLVHAVIVLICVLLLHRGDYSVPPGVREQIFKLCIWSVCCFKASSCFVNSDPFDVVSARNLSYFCCRFCKEFLNSACCIVSVLSNDCLCTLSCLISSSCRALVHLAICAS